MNDRRFWHRQKNQLSVVFSGIVQTHSFNVLKHFEKRALEPPFAAIERVLAF